MEDNPVSMCLPKGEAMEELREYLLERKFPISEYHKKNRGYRPVTEGLPVRAKIMAEKDVAIQVAAGNYDIGFCGLDWARELTVKYRGARLSVLKSLPLCRKKLFLCAGETADFDSVSDLLHPEKWVVLVSEYPNLAENFAILARLRRFKIFPAWGSVEGYPPEHADLVLLCAQDEKDLAPLGLKRVKGHNTDFESTLAIVANRKSLFKKNLTPVLSYFTNNGNQK